MIPKYNQPVLSFDPERLSKINEMIEIAGSEGIFCNIANRILGPDIRGPMELFIISAGDFETLCRRFEDTLSMLRREVR